MEDIGINRVLIFASYRDLQNLATLLEELIPKLRKSDCIVVADDSGAEEVARNKPKLLQICAKAGVRIDFLLSDLKAGRGAAIYRGLKFSLDKFENLEFALETDSDGSHTPTDIMKLLNAQHSDFLIGSRYLKESTIENWPLPRILLSWILNRIIPFVLRIKCSDITNGLRRYSKKTGNLLVSSGQSQNGFIYLSEQALICSNAGIHITEVPIRFVNRTHGQSTVGIHEIVSAIKGLSVILYLKIRDLR